jgi:hypothetical protein
MAANAASRTESRAGVRWGPRPGAARCWFSGLRVGMADLPHGNTGTPRATHFRSQAEAQAVLRADATEPNGLDGERDGLACENNPAPRDTVRVPR